MADRAGLIFPYKMAPMLVVMGAIFFLSHQPGDFVNLPGIFGLDKLLHAIAYGVLAGAVLFALAPGNKNRICLLAMVICLVYGISDETHQFFIPGRQASGWDIAADFVGSLIVVVPWRFRPGGKTPRG
jgi:VanZ family protein